MKTLKLVVAVSLNLFVSNCMADLVATPDNLNTSIPVNVSKEQNFEVTLKPIQVNLKKQAIQRKRAFLFTSEDLGDNTSNSALSVHDQYTQQKTANLINSITPDYSVRQGFLTLTKIPGDRRKESITFTFLMNPDKKLLAENKTNHVFKGQERTRLHVMWTGPKSMMKEQQIIEEDLPVNVSVARYDDGYAPEEWNVILPNKKPREVRVSLLWTF